MASNNTKALNDEDNLALDVSSTLDLGWLRNAIPYQLRMAQELSFQRYKEHLGQISSLSPGQLAALSVIALNPDCKQTDLGNAIGRDKSTLTPLLTRLERDGLITRERRDDNQRAYALNLTNQGKTVLRSLDEVGRQQEHALASLFTDTERFALLDYLSRIIAVATKAQKQKAKNGG